MMARVYAVLLCAGLLTAAAPSVAKNTASQPVTRALPVSQQSEPRQTDLPRPAEQSINARIALVIGNASYRYVPRLLNARNDAEDMCSALNKLGFETVCVFDVASRREFRDTIRKFVAMLSRDTAAFVYYAGHGVQLNGENYLLPTGIDVRHAADVEDEAISLTYILRSLEEAKTAPNIIILDACRDNPFSSSRFQQNGLARVDPPVGTVLVYATAPNAVAMDGQGRNGLFTKHLLQHIGKPGIKLDELFQMVANAVEAEARSVYRTAQVPYRTSSFSLPLCLAGCEDPDLANEIEEIRRQAGEYSRQIQDLTAERTKLSEENVRLRTNAQQRDAQISRLESRIAALSRESEQLREGRPEVQQELARLKEELAQLESSKHAAKQLEQENVLREAQIKELQARLQSQAQEMSAYRRKVEELQAERERTKQVRDSSPRNVPPRPKRPSAGIVVPNF